eukprot:280658-Prymnesium_polylepis.1
MRMMTAVELVHEFRMDGASGWRARRFSPIFPSVFQKSVRRRLFSRDFTGNVFSSEGLMEG